MKRKMAWLVVGTDAAPVETGGSQRSFSPPPETARLVDGVCNAAQLLTAAGFRSAVLLQP